MCPQWSARRAPTRRCRPSRRRRRRAAGRRRGAPHRSWPGSDARPRYRLPQLARSRPHPRVPEPRMVLGKCPPEHEGAGCNGRCDERPTERHPCDTERDDPAGPPQQPEHDHSQRVLSEHPNPAGAPVSAEEVGIPPPAGLLPEHCPDDHPKQRPANQDRDHPNQRTGHIGQQLDEKEVLSPPGIKGDKRTPCHRGNGGERSDNPPTPPKPHDRDHAPGDDRGKRRPPDRPPGEHPAEHEHGRRNGGVDRPAPTAEQLTQRGPGRLISHAPSLPDPHRRAPKCPTCPSGTNGPFARPGGPPVFHTTNDPRQSKPHKEFCGQPPELWTTTGGPPDFQPTGRHRHSSPPKAILWTKSELWI